MTTAEDNARLLVSIEATQAKYVKQLAAIAKASGDTATGIEQRFKKANDNAAKSFERGGKAAAMSIGQARGAAQNLSFQLNDIAQQLASGTSPFTVMIQQGSQVAQIFSASGGLGGAVRTLGGAFAGLLNPVSLASIALIGVAGYAAQYFGALISSGEESEEVLKKQADLIQRVADKWGDAVPALREYANELKRAAENGELQSGIEATIAVQYRGIRGVLGQLQVDLANVVDIQGQIGGQDALPKIAALQNAFENLRKKTFDNKATVADLNNVTHQLMDFFRSSGNTETLLLAASFGGLAAQIDNAADKTRELRQAQIGLSQSDPYLRDPRNTNRPTLALPGNAPTPERRVDPYFANPEQSGEKLGHAAAKEFDRFAGGTIDRYVNQVVKAESGGDRFAKNPMSSATGLGQFIESTWLHLFKQEFPDRAASMSRETILALRTNADISKHMIEALAQENFNILSQAGIAVNEAALHLAHFLGPGGAASVLKAAPGTPISNILSPAAIQANPSILGGGATRESVLAYADKRAGVGVEMAGDIDKATAAYNRAQVAAAGFTTEEKAAQQAAEQLGQAVGGALRGLVNAFADGKLEAQELLGIVVNLAQQLLRMPGGIGGGGFLGGLLGSIFHQGGVAGSGAPTRRVHPATFIGAPRYHGGGIAGIKPGEVPAILQRGEIVLPRGSRMGGGQVHVTVGVSSDANGNLMPFVQSIAQSEAGRATAALGKQVPRMVDARTDVRQTRKTRA